MKAPSSGGVPATSEEAGERKTINSELWHACAGPLVSLPPVGSVVVYFPQGHSEQVAASMQKKTDGIPNYPNLPSKLICILHNVTLHADAETDEVYAQMTLQPVTKFDKEALLASDLGLKQSKQPTEFFCKTLTASDTSTHGGFSVPRRAAEKIFPPLDFSMQPPAQELTAKDLHDISWTFRHIFRGQPKRHLLTTGWSIFVSAKRLTAGDSVLFVRGEKSQLLLGVRHANRQQPPISSSVLSSDSMHIGILAAAAHAAANHTPFTVFYNPRASPSEFVVPFAKYHKAVYGTHISLGMRFRMMFETEESGVRRYMGTITGISDIDTIRWKNSHWRNLQVGWDESTAGDRQNRVSLWEIEPVITSFYLCPPPFFRPKCFPQPGMTDEELQIENSFKGVMPWLTNEINIKNVQNPMQQGMSLVQWMNLQQNAQLLGSVTQPDCLSSMTQSSLHNIGMDDPSRQMVFQSHTLPSSNMRFGLPKFQLQNQQVDHLQQQNKILPVSTFPESQKSALNDRQLQQQQQQQGQQQQQPALLPLQPLVDQPPSQAQLQNQLLHQTLIQSKLLSQPQPQPFLGQNQQLQQKVLPFNQNTLQTSLSSQSLRFHQVMDQNTLQPQLPLTAEQLQLQLLQKLQQQQLQQQQQQQQLQQKQQQQEQLQPPPLQQLSQISPFLLPQQIQQPLTPSQSRGISIPSQPFQPENQKQQQQREQKIQQINPQAQQIGSIEFFRTMQNQSLQQEVQLVSPPSRLLPVSSSVTPAPTKGPVLVQPRPSLTDDNSRSSTSSPSANNCSTSGFINRTQQCSVRANIPNPSSKANLVQANQLKANLQTKQELNPANEVEQASLFLPVRNGATDHLDATSCSSFCLENAEHNFLVPHFQQSSVLLREGNQDPDIQVDPRNNLLFGVSIDGPLPPSLEAETLFSGGFGSGKDLQNMICGYGSPRDIEPELSTSAICSQSFGIQDMSFKPGCSNSTAVNESGFVNKSSRPPTLQRVRTFTKVYKRGSVGRSIDVTRYKGYDELRHDLACRFGIQGQLEDPVTSCWKLVYVDHENDILLVGDDPWEEFISCVQSIKILSATEVQQMSLDGALGNVHMPNQACSVSQDNVNVWRGYCEDNSINHSLGSFDH